MFEKMNKIMIREGKIEDIPQIIQVIHDSIQSCVLDHQREVSKIQTWLEKFDHASLIVDMLYNDCWVYLVHDKVVGFLLVSDTGEIRMHYIAPNYQRLGFGTQLFHQMHHTLLKKKIHQIEIQSTQTALSYYQRCGFHLHSAGSEDEVCLLYKYVF
ncbi:GNAT family N-acetyltransferase [Acinetobacter sp. 228]|uniref:GNAT family N-acetyltransferase n=1 Tax=Acinetobacter sp. 228 TaxID=3114700 RepID=UPI003A89CF04